MIPTLLETQSLIKYEDIQCIQIPPFQIDKLNNGIPCSKVSALLKRCADVKRVNTTAD